MLSLASVSKIKLKTRTSTQPIRRRCNPTPFRGHVAVRRTLARVTLTHSWMGGEHLAALSWDSTDDDAGLTTGCAIQVRPVSMPGVKGRSACHGPVGAVWVRRRSRRPQPSLPEGDHACLKGGLLAVRWPTSHMSRRCRPSEPRDRLWLCVETRAAVRCQRRSAGGRGLPAPSVPATTRIIGQATVVAAHPNLGLRLTTADGRILDLQLVLAPCA
jgi:hypothetical protein